MNQFDFTITKSSIDNGRIYFEGMEQTFFPADSIGGRCSNEHAASTVVIDAAGELIKTDIRINSSVRLSPRKSFRQWMRAQQAVQGGKARLYRVSERDYRLEYLG